MAIAAPLIASYDPLVQDVMRRLESCSGEHLFGTDGRGRDVCSRVVYETRISLPVGSVVTAVAPLVGSFARREKQRIRGRSQVCWGAKLWLTAFPGLAMLAIVMGFNLLGDGVRDAFDPHIRDS